MKKAATLAAVAVALAAAYGVQAGATGDSAYDPPVALDLTFIFHIDEQLAEQDVFYERQPGSGLVYRPTAATRELDAPLYAPAEPVAHSPLETDNIGPWKKGKPLGITLGQWLSAKGRGSYSCSDGQGHLKLAFESLVPGGVYTMWHYFMGWPPTEPFIGTYDLPMGARDGSESVFTADAAGNATFERRFKPCLQLSGEQLVSGLALALHSDGKTYGHEPGEFSTRSHVQMYVGLPKRAGI